MSTLLKAHEQWKNRPQDQRFRSLEDLRASVDARAASSREDDVLVSDMFAFDGGSGLRVARHSQNDEQFEMTHWAFGQLAQRVGAPASFLRKLELDTLVPVLNERINAQSIGAKVKAMWKRGSEGLHTLQAVTGPTYGRIWDSEVLSMVETLVDRSDGKFFNPKAYNKETGTVEPSGLYASDRDIFMFMIDGGSNLDLGPRAQLNRGFFVWNSEVGSSQVGISTFLFNQVCGNHMVFGASEVSTRTLRHTSRAPERFEETMSPMLLQAMDMPPETEVIIRAQSKRLQDVKGGGDDIERKREQWVSRFADAHGFTHADMSEGVACAFAEEGQCDTVWDVIMGLTARARDLKHIDARSALERKAGKLLALAR